MATITKPMALDESFNTTESTSRNQADVLAGIEEAIRQGFGQVASAVEYDNIDSGLTADNVQDAIDEVDDTVDGLVDDVAEISSDIESTQIASGNPITLTDAAPINAESLVVELEPQQNLHGQSAPYVGGAGKNKLGISIATTKTENPGSWSGDKITVGSASVDFKTNNGYVTECILNSTASDRFNITVSFTLKAGSYIYSSGFSEILYTTDTFLTLNDVAIARGNSSSPGQSFTLQEDATLKWILRIYDKANTNVVVKPMIRLATETDASFAPYSNICPISGYEGVEVDDVGFNQWDGTLESGAYSYASTGAKNTSSGYKRSADFIKVNPNTQYACGYSESVGVRVGFYDTNKGYLSSFVNISQSEKSFTTPSACEYITFDIQSSADINISINYPSTDTDYHPYQSRTASVTFGQTVYGGSVDFLTGVVTVDRALEVFDGSNDEGWFGRNNDRSRSTSKLQGIIKNASSDGVAVDFIKSNMFKKGSADEGWGGNPNIIGVGTDGIIYTSTGETMSISDWTTYLVNNNLQICYELATPFTLQLTPQELKLLQGTNNITTNGTTINLGYQPDNVIGEVKGEIEKCAVDAEFMQFTDGTDTFTDVNLSLDAFFHTVSVVGSKIEQKRFICFEVMDKMGGALQGILASCIAFTDGAKTPSGTAFRAYIESLQMYVNFRIYGSGGSYTLAYQSESSFSASAFFVRVRMMNNL